MDGDGGSVEICPGRYVVLAVQPWRFPLPLYTNTNCGALSLEWRGARWTGLYWIWVNITEKNNLKSWKKKLTLILVPWIKLHSDKKERGNKRDWHVSVDIIVTVLQAEISVLRLAKASLLRSFWFYAFFTLFFASETQLVDSLFFFVSFIFFFAVVWKHSVTSSILGITK